jgi:hypothetical protein
MSGGAAVRRESSDIPRQQLVDPVDRMLTDAGDQLAQIGLGLYTIETCRANMIWWCTSKK